MAAEKEEKNYLKDAFMGAVKVATVGVAAAVAWQIIMDPIFWDVVHNMQNYPNMAAWSNMVNHYMGWMPEAIGLKGSGGLLNTEFGQAVLGPFKVLKTVETPDKVAQAAGAANLSPSDMMDSNPLSASDLLLN